LIARLQKDLKPDNPELRFLKAYSQRDSNPAGAREALRVLALADRTYFARARMLVARIHADQGNQAAAAKELEALAAEVDKTGDRAELPAVLRALAAVQVSAGKPAEAAGVLDRYAKKYPDLPSISYLLAQLRLQAADAAGAQSALKSLIARHADDAPAYALAGQIARSRNSLAEAEMNLQKALALDSSLVPARIDLAGVYVSRKDWAKAEATLKEGIDRNRDDAALQYELAGVYDAAGRWQDANLYYRSVLRADPNHVPSLNNLALNLAEQSGDLAAAKTYAEKAFRLDNTDPTVQDTYGWILVLGNDTKNGLPLLQRAARAFPKDSTVSYHLGAALIKAGRLPEGKRLVQDALTSGLPENLRDKAQSLVD
jgi:tetratricopeptide (TPR) repeat protein